MPLDTNLNTAPYFDDFDESKHYHRILFKPSNAVQTRELNQIQSILQNQIERLGGSIYKDGAVISGCGVGYYNPLDYVRVADHAANGALLDVTGFVGKTVESTISGLAAKIITVKPGSEQNYPWTNRLYVSYTNSGMVGNTQIQKFVDNDSLVVYDTPRSANVQLSAFNSILSQNVSNTGIGTGYGVSVTSGMIYQKGFFITVDPQTVVVSDSINPGNTAVGFVTNESIITAEQDDTLYDNSLGYANPTAPGADRLKLSANLACVSANDLSTTSGFTTVCQFIGGIPVIENSADRYSVIGEAMKKVSFETNGSFVIKPFSVTTAYGNASHIIAQVAPGSGYAQGTRVELLRTTPVTIRRGNDTDVLESQLITTNYGNYMLCNEMAGSFDFDNLQTVDIYNAPQQAVTKRTFGTTGISGTKIGTATLRCVKYAAGTPGTPTCQYDFYIFNVQMNAGANFGTQAKSIVYSGGSAFADILFINGQNLFNSERRAMLWHFGTSALKTLKDASNNVNTQYVVRHRSNSTMAIDGTISLTLTTSHAGGTNQFPYGTGVVGAKESDFTVVLQSAAQSPSLGNVAVSGNVVTGTSFTSRFSVNEYILVGTDVRRITAVTNATSMTVDANFSAANAAIGHSKYFPAGYSFPLVDTMVGTRTVTVNSPTSVTINTGAAIAGNLTSTAAVSIYHNILRYNAVPAKKTINKKVYVQIDTSTHVNTNKGPWSLGLTDVHKLQKVAVGPSFSETNTDLATQFYFDTGMRDTHYDLASLYLRPGSSIAANSKIVVILDTFTLNTSPGIGFLSVDSYPIDDASTANTTAIQTADIPLYVSESGARYPLRDCIDFRPYKTNTANIATSMATATTNPAQTSATFNLDTAGAYVPSADENFEADLTYYLGRKDMIYFSNQGYVKTIEGNSSTNPVTPQAPTDAMGIAVLNVPPFPSLSAEEMATESNINRTVYNAIRDTSQPVATSIITNKRYRMQDIATLDKRISRMEYYTALNALEQATTSLQVSDSNGLDRFKNGIFVDPFNDFSISDVSNPEYKIAIDSALGIARPFFEEKRPELSFDLQSSTSIVQNSRLLTLPFTKVQAITQRSATNFRACSSVQYRWTGKMNLYPQYGHNVDTVANAATNVSLDLATPWQDFANSPFGMQWGDWRVTDQQSSTVSTIAGTTIYGTEAKTGYDTTTTTTTSYSRDGSQLNVGTNTTSYNLGSYVQNIAVQPYIASVEIAFYAWGVRPSTNLHAFFDDTLVDDFCAPGVRNTSVTDTTSSNYVTRTQAWGTPLVSNSDGTLYGKFLVPASKFRVGDRVFKLSDIKFLDVGASAATTSASATYTASNFAVTTGSTTLTTVNPTISTSALTDAYSTTTSQTTTGVNVTTLPPMQIINNYYTTNITQESPPAAPVVTPPAQQIFDQTPVLPSDPTPPPPPPPPPPPDAPPAPPPPPPAPQTITYPCGATFLASDVQAALDQLNAQNFPGLATAGGQHFTGSWTIADIANWYCQSLAMGLGTHGVMGDPIAQMFQVSIQNGITGMYITDLTLYFQNKSANPNIGCTVYVCEVTNGYPDTSKTIPFSTKWLPNAQIQVSDTGQVATTFTFDAPVFLNNNTRYAFITVPDGGDPDYRVWTAVLGNDDVYTGAQISSKPYIDSAYYSTNQATWTALQDEYIKFDISRASFTATSGSAYFTTTPADYVNITNVVNANANLNIAVGDTVWGANSTANVANAVGKVSEYYVANGYMKIVGTQGGWNNATTIKAYRLASDTDTPTANNLVASATLAGVQNIKMNAIVPRFASIAPSGTSIDMTFNAASNTYVLDSSAITCNSDVETEMFDYERVVYSRSNEVTNVGGAKLFKMNVNLKSDSSYMSPAIDLIRSNFLAISNIIDPTSYDMSVEYGNNGSCKTKYVSKVVTLANGQDSEDLQVYLTAFRPQGTKIAVFAKFANGEDPETIINKTWTPLAIDDDTVFSNYKSVTDYRELLFTVPNTIPSGAPSTTAYVDTTNGLTYVASSGSTFTSFKKFQLKIVLLSDSTALVPRLNDVRALAMLL